MICRTKYIDQNYKKNGLSKREFIVGEEVKGKDAEALSAVGVAVSEEKYDDIAKRKGTVPIRKKTEKK